MLCDFEKKVLAFIVGEQLLPAHGRLLLAVSGGADSIALMHALWSLRAENRIEVELLCAHMNHHLRGKESDGDEQFVVSQATNLGIQVITNSKNIKQYAISRKLSVETAARKWRIDTLQEIAEQQGCKYIATGHHVSDNAETIVQRLIRGTGFRGLAGIWPKRRFVNTVFVRPLLCVNRADIDQYLKSRNVTWREDSSNAELDYRRNFIRHKLIPHIQNDCSEPVDCLLWRLATEARRFESTLQRYIEGIWQKLTEASPGRVVIELTEFLKGPELIKVALLRKSLLWLGSGERDLTERHYNDAIDFARQRVSNRVLELPNGFRLWREYKRLVLAAPEKRVRDEDNVPGPTVDLNVPGKTIYGNWIIETAVKHYDTKEFEQFKLKKDGLIEWFDLDKVVLPLSIRFRRKGDRFMPLGMSDEKKVGQFLTDAQVPQDQRKKVLIVADDDKIIWLCPLRKSEKTKLTDKTKKVLEIKVSPYQCQ